ncbi:MAG: hypothetical protein J6O73_09260, partial [Lachnospiraceae bacterium]|nr:hypothetical protein [Lachnospiraceae bacterium]
HITYVQNYFCSYLFLFIYGKYEHNPLTLEKSAFQGLEYVLSVTFWKNGPPSLSALRQWFDMLQYAACYCPSPSRRRKPLCFSSLASMACFPADPYSGQ